MYATKKGAALALVLLAIIIISILGLAILHYTLAETRASERDVNRTRAYYLARSGVQVVCELLAGNFHQLKDHFPLNLQGSLSDGFVLNYNNYEGPFTSHDIIIVVAWEDEEQGKGIITSYGNYNKENARTRKYFNVGVKDDLESLFEPTGDSVEAGPDGLAWHKEDGQLIAHGGTFSGPVTFSTKSYEHVIYKQDSGNPSYDAPAMYFVDEPTSLEIAHNAVLRLYVNLLVFKGDISFTEHGIHTGAIEVKTLSSQITGSDIGGLDVAGNLPQLYANYGVIYIANSIWRGSELLNIYNGEKITGFYFFPSNMEIGAGDWFKRLIPINDMTAIDFDKLNVDSIAGNISPGEYH